MIRNGVAIDDGFAEAFPMKGTRLIITAHNAEWARHAAVAATGFATSVIACGCEAGGRHAGVARPFDVVCRNDDARGLHRKGLGKGVVDDDAAAQHGGWSRLLHDEDVSWKQAAGSRRPPLQHWHSSSWPMAMWSKLTEPSAARCRRSRFSMPRS